MYSFLKLCFPDVVLHYSLLSWILLTILIIASVTRYCVIVNHIIQLFFTTLINMLNSTVLFTSLFRLLCWPFPNKNRPFFPTLQSIVFFKFAGMPLIQFFPIHQCISNNITLSCTWLTHFLICSSKKNPQKPENMRDYSPLSANGWPFLHTPTHASINISCHISNNLPRT